MLPISPFLIPPDDAARLVTLRRYAIHRFLDEKVFNELVSLAARIFSLPISLIALVDETEVEYIANYGMPGNDVQSRQEALCATAILRNSAVVYKDLLADNEPFITPQAAQAAQQNNIRFYAAAPLRMPDRCNIGTLCIIDYHPRTLIAAEQHLLEHLADVVSHALVVRRQCQDRGAAGELHWQTIRAHLAAEIQGLTALVRYMLTRYGVQVPLSNEVLTQIERRLPDLHEVLRPVSESRVGG
ncbi:GAF domain-containing protein [Hymenobacter aerilatus]|uniref:GAF domain-containing protein n=1 Tax=Hymenobacter aerilatus TaxID=2932251 RepID=A0A8T9SXV1_9BACT|nr:GAF domain-containing protein [Hymenobacter aerilatus]UOR06211.1 GAF domain-containing protein [Hymenobacter aerilatus]